MKNLKNQIKKEVKQINETSKKKLSLENFKIEIGDASKIVGGSKANQIIGERQDCGH